jgi:integrase
MRGVNPAYIALQLGPSVKTLLEVYARWIEGADRGTERRMIQAAMESNLPLICPSAPDESCNALEKKGNW